MRSFACGLSVGRPTDCLLEILARSSFVCAMEICDSSDLDADPIKTCKDFIDYTKVKRKRISKKKRNRHENDNLLLPVYSMPRAKYEEVLAMLNDDSKVKAENRSAKRCARDVERFTKGITSPFRPFSFGTMLLQMNECMMCEDWTSLAELLRMANSTQLLPAALDILRRYSLLLVLKSSYCTRADFEMVVQDVFNYADLSEINEFWEKLSKHKN